MKEIWKEIANTDGAYEISNLGRVRSFLKRIKSNLFIINKSKEPKILKPWNNGWDRQCVTLFCHDKRKHHLVSILALETFIGERPKDFEGAHLNGDSNDNSLKNLKWCSRKENCSHKKLHGTHLEGSRLPFSKFKEKDIIEIRKTKKYFGYQRDLAKKYNVNPSAISSIICGSKWKHVI